MLMDVVMMNIDNGKKKVFSFFFFAKRHEMARMISVMKREIYSHLPVSFYCEQDGKSKYQAIKKMKKAYSTNTWNYDYRTT